MREISVDVYAEGCIWQDKANADDAVARPICLLRTGNHFDSAMIGLIHNNYFSNICAERIE